MTNQDKFGVQRKNELNQPQVQKIPLGSYDNSVHARASHVMKLLYLGSWRKFWLIPFNVRKPSTRDVKKA